jgi:cell division protein FtsB
MLEKLTNPLKKLPNAIQNNKMVRQLQDIRTIGMLLFLVAALMVSWSGAKVIQTNYELQKQISRIQQEIQVQQLANANLKLQNQYFQTDQYLELQARQDFGLGGAGETQVIVPREVALKYAATSASDKPAVQEVHQPTYQRNFQAWIDFFLHRSNPAP